MTCRHGKGDPNCSSYQSRLDAIASDYRTYVEPATPDAAKFEIEDAVQIGPHMVLKVHYPNCIKCKYEGNKVMVFLDVTPLDVMKWRRIDPHFRDPRDNRAKNVVIKDAPSPAARFPASPEGWEDAKEYARWKSQGGVTVLRK